MVPFAIGGYLFLCTGVDFCVICWRKPEMWNWLSLLPFPKCVWFYACARLSFRWWSVNELASNFRYTILEYENHQSLGLFMAVRFALMHRFLPRESSQLAARFVTVSDHKHWEWGNYSYESSRSAEVRFLTFPFNMMR